MIQSMTGYGKADCELAGNKIIAEIKSLNSKQLDLSMRVAPQYREKDLEIRNIIARRLERGKVDFALYVENALENEEHQINTAVVENYYWQIKQMADNMRIPVPNNWFEILLKLPDVFKNNENTTADDVEWQTVVDLINTAIDRFTEFRAQEGETLQNMFEEKIARIGELLDSIEPYEIERIAKIRARIEENMAILAENSKIDIDRNRLEQEMIYYIEKLDVNEEKVRLRNHLKYFTETMHTEKAPGKKLGFIAQEIGREINTLGSKSNHSEMQRIVVMMKDQLEQIKEQVLNVL